MLRFGKILQPICFIAIVSLCIFGTSCKTGNSYSRQTAALDSLNRLVHQADSALKVVDTLKIKKCADHVVMALQLVRMSHKDSMSKSSAEIFRNFSSVRWELETFLGRRTVMLMEMHKSMDQMARLSHDLKYNLIKADSVPMYYGQEVKRASLLIESEKMSTAKLNNELPLYDLIAPQADSLVSLIKNHKDI